MSKVFRYRVCQTQRSRVTFVNGRWLGLQIDNADAETLYNSCPLVWEYLEAAGREGWELVAASSHAESAYGERSNAANLLFLKKKSRREDVKTLG
ncbi:MAG TPA: hypothetical protein VF658_11755 [Pyrinomonadaceae bacterium]